MNLGQYQRCSQVSAPPMAFYYDGSQVVSSQPNDKTRSFDRHPRLPLENEFFGACPSTIGNFNTPASMSTAQPSAEWVSQAYSPPTFDDASLLNDCGYCYQSSSVFAILPQNEGFSLGQMFDGIPASWQLTHNARMATESTALAPKGCEGASCLRDQSNDEAPSFPSLEPATLYNNHDRSRGFSQLSGTQSPNAERETLLSSHLGFESGTCQRMQLSEASDDSGTSSREMTVVELEDLNADEPYAKLIYRALMSTNNHAMVLQEIYQWFRDNTSKGNDDTKGWMNSIRHNLSMNAAFRKSERKVSGDETKKSTEWVLEEFAIKDGVQSTTRYRKGTGNKKVARSDNPTLARQTSGRKGGLCTSKAKLQRQKLKEDRTDRRSTPRIDTSRQLRLHRNSRTAVQRQMSPLTPPNLENVTNPYFFPKSEPLDLPFEDIYGLEDVQGVYLDDHGPLFSKGHPSPFNNKHSLAVDRH